MLSRPGTRSVTTQQSTTPAALHILASCAPITLQYDSLSGKSSKELCNAHWFSYRAEAAGFHRLLFQVLFEWSEHALLDSNAPTPTGDSDPLYIQWSELTQLTNVYLRFCVAFEPNSHAECTCGLQSGLCLYLCWTGARSRSLSVSVIYLLMNRMQRWLPVSTAWSIVADVDTTF